MSTNDERAAFERWRVSTDLGNGEWDWKDVAYEAWLAGARHENDRLRAAMMAGELAFGAWLRGDE